ncbi:MAG: hypothetical protein V4506_01850 [Bacteroidota bacterium]
MELSQQPISVKKLVFKKLATPTVSAILLMALFSMFTFKYWMDGAEHIFQRDVDQYYSYLIAEFIHHDFSFHFPHHYWLIETPTGHYIPKVTMGMAILYFPFFIIGNNIAFIFGYDPLGYSAPFSWCVHFGTILYVFIGFWYMRKTFLLLFSEWVSAITMLLIFFATNLFYYTFREGEMSHSYLFFLFSLFFYHTVKWHFTKKIKYLFYFTFIAGFITLIRPTEILVLMIPLLYQVKSIKDLTTKLKELIALKWKLIIVVILFLLPLIPQMLFWKEYTGRYLYFSYGSDEHFFFTDPKIYSILFGWHKGWFIYTPLALFMVAGLVMMFFKWKNMALPIAVYLVLNIYIVSSWWDWGFGGAFGMRALVQCFAFMALPLAYFISRVLSIRNIKLKVPTVIATFLVFTFFAVVNLFQMWENKIFVFHWDAMTKQSYEFMFFRTNYTQADRDHLETLLKHPDYAEMKKGKRDEQ